MNAQYTVRLTADERDKIRYALWRDINAITANEIGDPKIDQEKAQLAVKSFQALLDKIEHAEVRMK